MKSKIKYVNAEELPDLLTEEDYAQEGAPKKIKLRLKATERGIEILGDSMYPEELEALLRGIGAEEIGMVLCG